jgi:tetratricopeptide (TPR) repeat protein
MVAAGASGPPRSPDPDEVVRSALAARDAGRSDEGVNSVRTALGHYPRNALLWQVLGLLHRAREDSAAAMEAFDQAARLAPGDARIAHGHARVTMEAGLPALSLFERARNLSPLDGDLLTSRAAAQLAEGRGEEAIAELDAMLGNSPLWIQGHEALAALRWMLGEREIFTQSFEQALAEHPSNLELWLALIGRFTHAEMYAEADVVVARARRAAGPGIALDVAEAACASETGDVPRADHLFEALSALDNIALHVRHIRHLLRTGRTQAAGARIEPLLRRPDAEQVWPYAAIAWRLLGDSRWEWLEADPRLVGVYDIMAAADIAPLRDRLRSLHNTVADPIGQSVRGGTQTDGPLFARIDPEIRALRALIVRTVENHVRQFAPKDPNHPVLSREPGASVRFAGSWSVRLAGAGHHTHHIHPQGWISSAFYVTVPDEVELGPPPAGWLALGKPPAELGIDLAPFRTVEPKPGRLVLFPSIMWHGTMPFTGGERMSVAFDVAPPA